MLFTCNCLHVNCCTSFSLCHESWQRTPQQNHSNTFTICRRFFRLFISTAVLQVWLKDLRGGSGLFSTITISNNKQIRECLWSFCKILDFNWTTNIAWTPIQLQYLRVNVQNTHWKYNESVLIMKVTCADINIISIKLKWNEIRLNN